MNRYAQSLPLSFLVVEDNPGDFFLLKESIEATSIPVANIHLADTLASAIEYLHSNKPDIIFLDLFLPDSSGLGSFDVLNEYITHSAVIILSGLSDTKAAREAIALGAQDFLAKGEFDEQLLEKTIMYSLERKRNLVTLHAANERFNLVSRATHDLIWDLDLQTGTIYRDENGLKNVYGLSSNDLIKDAASWDARIHPDDKERVLALMAEVKISTGINSFEMEYRFRTESGSYNYIYDRGYIVRTMSGKPIRLIGAAQDITERKNNEAALSRQQALFRVLIERSPDMKAMITPEGKILYCTPAITNILGYLPEEYLGINEKEIIHPSDTAALFTEINKTIEDPKYIGRLQVRVRHKDGHYRWCDKIITNLLHDPYVHAIVCNFWDITKEKEIEEKTRVSEEKYRQIFYDNPFPMFLYDIETLEILECNDTAPAKYGFTRDEFLQLNVLDIMPADDINKELLNTKAPESQLRDGNRNRIWRHVKKNGEVMMVEVFIYTIEYDNKKVRQAQINDVTENLKLSRDLEEFRQQQQRAVTKATIEGQEKEREQLGIELHDNINQILASAKLYLDYGMSSTPVKTEILDKSKELIVMATQEIRKLSHALLPPSLEEFGLTTAIDELLHPVYDTKNIIVENKWKNFQEQVLTRDQKLTVYRIVQEQVNNILKHAAATKIMISLRLCDDGESVELVISDDGKGFDTTQKKNGVGLRNITSRAGMFGGKVSIRSAPGEGCDLKVTIKGAGIVSV